jgi:hypothetical protein
MASDREKTTDTDLPREVAFFEDTIPSLPLWANALVGALETGDLVLAKRLAGAIKAELVDWSRAAIFAHAVTVSLLQPDGPLTAKRIKDEAAVIRVRDLATNGSEAQVVAYLSAMNARSRLAEDLILGANAADIRRLPDAAGVEAIMADLPDDFLGVRIQRREKVDRDTGEIIP